MTLSKLGSHLVYDIKYYLSLMSAATKSFPDEIDNMPSIPTREQEVKIANNGLLTLSFPDKFILHPFQEMDMCLPTLLVVVILVL